MFWSEDTRDILERLEELQKIREATKGLHFRLRYNSQISEYEAGLFERFMKTLDAEIYELEFILTFEDEISKEEDGEKKS